MGSIYSVQYQEDISSRKVCWRMIFWWHPSFTLDRIRLDSLSLQPSHKPDRWTAGSPVLVLLPLMSPSRPWGLSFLELSGLWRDVTTTAVLSELFVSRRTKLKAPYSNNCWPRSAIYNQSLTWFLKITVSYSVFTFSFSILDKIV